MTDWKQVLAKHQQTIAMLEQMFDTKDFGTEYESVSNHYIYGNDFGIECEYCNVDLADAPSDIYHNSELDTFFCEEDCVVYNIRDRIMNIKVLSIPNIEQLIAEEE